MGRQQELIFDQRRGSVSPGAGLGCQRESGHSISIQRTRVSLGASPDDCGLFLWLPELGLCLVCAD